MTQEAPRPALPFSSASPPPPAASPPGGPNGFFPPNKRPRLSPTSSSTNISPHPYTPTGLPPPISDLPIGAPEGSMSGQAPAVMGPPSRPVERATNASELTDAIAQSGIDVKEEENYLTAYFSQARAQNGPSFSSNAGSSFESAYSAGSDPSPRTGGLTFQYHAHPVQTGPGPYYGGGVFGQPSTPAKSPDEIAQEEWKAAARRKAQQRSAHLNDPFLNGNSLRTRMGRRAYENGIRVPQEGVSEKPLPAPQRVATKTGTGPDGTSVTSVNATFLENDTQLADVLSLLSLAAEDRIRGLIEDAAALAAGRRLGSHGKVPSEFTELATGARGERGASANATNGHEDWEQAVSPRDLNLKRSRSAPNLGLHPGPDAELTLSFPNNMAKTLRGIAAKEREQEEVRLAKRARRQAAKDASAESAPSGGTVPGTPGAIAAASPAPGTPSDRAPEPDNNTVPVKKMSKKELARQQSAKLDEAHQHKSANTTARMMLGSGSNLFGKKKGGGYSWMNPGGGAGKAGQPNRPNAPGPGGEPVDAASPGAGGANGTALPVAYGKRIGEWREDRDKAPSVQLRDLVHALENDGKGAKSLAIAYSKLK